jgi:hypothetical protein
MFEAAGSHFGGSFICPSAYPSRRSLDGSHARQAAKRVAALIADVRLAIGNGVLERQRPPTRLA